METVRALAAAGAAVNIGFVVGGAVGSGDRLTPGSLLTLIALAILGLVPFVLAAVQAKPRRAHSWALRLLGAALLVGIVVAMIAYTSASRDVDRSGVIFVIVPVFQLILVGFALAIADLLRSRSAVSMAESDTVEPDSDESDESDSVELVDPDDELDSDDPDDEDSEPGEPNS